MGKKDKSGAKRRRRLEEQKEREAGIESMNNRQDTSEIRALNSVNNNNNNNGHDDSRPTIYNNKGLLSKCDAIDLNLDFHKH